MNERDGLNVLEIVVEENSQVAIKLIKELNKEKILPSDTRIVLIKRNNQIIIPDWEARVFVKDVVVVLSMRNRIPEVSVIFGN